MKKLTLKIAFIFSLTIATATASFAHDGISKYASSTELLSTYLNLNTLENNKIDTKLFSNDFTYENLNNKRTNSKKEYLTFLKRNENLKYNCTTKYEVFDENNNIAIAKATFTFDEFTRVDYITMVKENNAWKISKITTSFIK